LTPGSTLKLIAVIVSPGPDTLGVALALGVVTERAWGRRRLGLVPVVQSRRLLLLIEALASARGGCTKGVGGYFLRSLSVLRSMITAFVRYLAAMDRRSAGRLAIAIVVLVIALILASVGVPGAAVIALVALAAMFLISFLARWSWRA
jgi:hypothetical protein